MWAYNGRNELTGSTQPADRLEHDDDGNLSMTRRLTYTVIVVLVLAGGIALWVTYTLPVGRTMMAARLAYRTSRPGWAAPEPYGFITAGIQCGDSRATIRKVLTCATLKGQHGHSSNWEHPLDIYVWDHGPMVPSGKYWISEIFLIYYDAEGGAVYLERSVFGEGARTERIDLRSRAVKTHRGSGKWPPQ